jgi:DNA polymerase
MSTIGDFASWRERARELLRAGMRPEDASWSDERTPSLFTHAPSTVPADTAHLKLPRELLRLLEDLAQYRDAGRWELMYRLTWRVMHESRSLLQNDADVDVATARRWSKAIHRDVHKMHAFVRFHEARAEDGVARYVAWFEPKHEILRSTAPFFERRFPNMQWMIATPDGAALWDGTRTRFIDSPRRASLPNDDSTHVLWRTYYRNICNGARINPQVMQREMPQRYWKHLPEASEIHRFLHEGRSVHHQTLHSSVATENRRMPQAVVRSLAHVALPAESPLSCRRCDLWQRATQPVLGDGPEGATIMLVGEQPGDEEDLHGRPFVGPAGGVLDQALLRAGVQREAVFITNAVKHFKWEPRGKRRLHRRPDQHEVRACSEWLEREIAAVSPRVLVALGSTAIRALTGQALRVDDARSMALRHPGGATIVCTYHPSAILRAEADHRAELIRLLTEDLQRADALTRARS